MKHALELTAGAVVCARRGSVQQYADQHYGRRRSQRRAQSASISGFCGTCHDTPNVGNHSVKAPLNIGIANAGANAPPALDISGLPVFTLQCTSGPLAGQSFVVTDPGRAMITGNCADIGKLKGPILRGLAARAPNFHNGSAATLWSTSTTSASISASPISRSRIL